MIVYREYITRVRTKSFIIITLLMPVILLVMVGAPILINKLIGEDNVKRQIYVIDQTGVLMSRLYEENSELYVDAAGLPEDSLKKQLLDKEINGYVVLDSLHITENKAVQVLTDGSGGITFGAEIRGEIANAIYQEKIHRANLSDEVKDIIQSKNKVSVGKLTESGETDDSLSLFFLGYVLAFLMYGALFIYGSIVMRGVLEEKTNRIVEVITSSVKPFELMLGKVLGVGMLGLTQFGVWIGASTLITGILIPLFMTGGSSTADVNAAEAMQQMEESGFSMNIPEISWVVWVVFIINFIFGYLLYSSLFAAVGSAVDNESDTQQLVFPIGLPIIIAILLMPVVTSSPESTLAIVTSLIPLLSPILMTARVSVVEVPFWELGLSFVLMAATFMLFIMLAGKIYRVGILMYGKKAGFKEIYKWMRYS